MIATLETSTSLVPATPQVSTIPDGRIFLKVKIKSLAAEAKIIREMEKKGGIRRDSLRWHRIGIVREESRLTQLAYGFIRGRSYRNVEEASNAPDWKRVRAMVEKYAGRHKWNTDLRWQPDREEIRARFQLWSENATEIILAKKRK